MKVKKIKGKGYTYHRILEEVKQKEKYWQKINWGRCSQEKGTCSRSGSWSSLCLGRLWAHCQHEKWRARMRSEAENKRINLKSRLRTLFYSDLPPYSLLFLHLLPSFPLCRALSRGELRISLWLGCPEQSFPLMAFAGWMGKATSSLQTDTELPVRLPVQNYTSSQQ